MHALKFIMMLLVLTISSLSVSSQPGMGRRFDERMRAIESRRVAHITDQLSLNPKEARVFWPVYNEYLEKINKLSGSQREWLLQIQNIGSLTDAEAANLAEREVIRLEQTAALRREYHEKLKEIIPIKKLALLYEAEQTFNRMLVRESQHRMRLRE